MEIVVYKAEQEAGLESQIRANASVAWQSDVQLCEAFDLGGAKASLLPEHAVAENKNQIDLHYLRTVMVSSAWNLNDDIFTPEEMWLARATPEDKPFNYMHEQSDIIGHITNAVAVDESMRPIPEDTPSDKLPEHYHIVTNAVLYKFWEKPELQERMNRLIAEIADNRWFVSMEALFYGFDYALKTAKGWQIIERNDKTAFLTKHLRAYGGKGEFEGKKLGRVLRRIVFSGKGLVSKPANPESVILEASKASGYELPREETHTMSAEIETIQAEAAEAKAKSEKHRPVRPDRRGLRGSGRQRQRIHGRQAGRLQGPGRQGQGSRRPDRHRRGPQGPGGGTEEDRRRNHARPQGSRRSQPAQARACDVHPDGQGCGPPGSRPRGGDRS